MTQKHVKNNVVKNIKNLKAFGRDRINAELINWCKKKLYKSIHKIYSKLKNKNAKIFKECGFCTVIRKK